MQSKDVKEFAAMMKALARVYDDRNDQDPVKIELYFKILEPYTIEQIRKAVNVIFDTRVYSGMPKPAEIIQAIKQDNHLALKAWVKFESAIRYSGKLPGDPLMIRVMSSMGGLERFERSTTEELVWLQKEFERRYDAYSQDDSLGMLEDSRRERLTEIIERIGKNV